MPTPPGSWSFNKNDPRIKAFPIPTRARAVAALAVLDMPENADIREQVKTAVYRKYPELKSKAPRPQPPPGK